MPDLGLPEPDAESAVQALARVPYRLETLWSVATDLRSAGRFGRLARSQRESLRDLLDGLNLLGSHYRLLADTLLEPDPFCGAHAVLFEPVLRAETARAIRSWRLSEYDLSEIAEHLVGGYVECALRVARELERRTATTDELVRHHRSGGWREWIEHACRFRPDGMPLWQGIVREAAFWRRACQLIAGATCPPPPDGRQSPDPRP